MNRFNSGLDIAKERNFELGGKSRKLSRWNPEMEIMEEFLGDMEDKMKKSNMSTS